MDGLASTSAFRSSFISLLSRVLLAFQLPFSLSSSLPLSCLPSFIPAFYLPISLANLLAELFDKFTCGAFSPTCVCGFLRHFPPIYHLLFTFIFPYFRANFVFKSVHLTGNLANISSSFQPIKLPNIMANETANG